MGERICFSNKKIGAIKRPSRPLPSRNECRISNCPWIIADCTSGSGAVEIIALLPVIEEFRQTWRHELSLFERSTSRSGQFSSGLCEHAPFSCFRSVVECHLHTVRIHPPAVDSKTVKSG
jgi:hypothetical protein